MRPKDLIRPWPWCLLALLFGLIGCAAPYQSDFPRIVPNERELGYRHVPKARPYYQPTSRPSLPRPTHQSTLYNGAPSVRAESMIMIDPFSGRVLAAKNADTARAVASTQKLLTALIALEQGNLGRPITVAPEDTKVPASKLYLRAGEQISRADLLSAVLIKSANDAAMVLARDTAGSVPAFASRMNRLAYRLGARNTNFVNPHGLTEANQFSTARDMSRIASHAYRNSFIRNTVRREVYSVRTSRGTKSLTNTNKLLARMIACNGMKTGYTKASGKCLISTASRGGKSVLLVQLGSKSSSIWNDGQRLMEWGLRQQERVSIPY